MRTRVASFGAVAGIILIGFGCVPLLLNPRMEFAATPWHFGVGAALLVVSVFLLRHDILGRVRARTTRAGAFVSAYTALVLGIAIALNALGAATNQTLADVTEAGVFTLSPETTQILNALPGPVRLIGFYLEAPPPNVRGLLTTFAVSSPQVTVEYVDPDKKPQVADDYNVRVQGTVVVYGTAHQLVRTVDEETILNAIYKLSAEEVRQLCVLAGHGEPSVPATETDAALDGPRGIGIIVQRLRDENYQLRELVLLSESAVPETCSAVVLIGPRRTFAPAERTMLSEYLAAGGRLIALVDPPPAGRGAAGLETLFAQWGIAVERTMLLERTQAKSLSDAGFGVQVVVRTYGRHPITRSFIQPTMFPLATTVRPTSAMPAGVHVSVLAQTSPTSWAETNIRSVTTGRATWRDGDRQGPLPIAVAAEKTHLLTSRGAAEGQRSAQTRVVVIGDSDFITNSNSDTFYNADFFLSAVAWTAGLEQRIALRPKATRASRLDMSAQERVDIFYLYLVYLPEAILLGGLAIVWLRRTE